MNKHEIQSKLIEQYKAFTEYIESLDETQFMFAVAGKWSAGQQVDHLIRAIKPINLAMGLPLFLLKLLFGRANRPGRSYEELVAKYQSKLAAGGRASGRFLAKPVQYSQKQILNKTLMNEATKLASNVNELDENKLDILVLPHPLLGKLTLREMMYFTIYHGAHHHQLATKYLQEKNL